MRAYVHWSHVAALLSVQVLVFCVYMLSGESNGAFHVATATRVHVVARPVAGEVLFHVTDVYVFSDDEGAARAGSHVHHTAASAQELAEHRRCVEPSPPAVCSERFDVEYMGADPRINAPRDRAYLDERTASALMWGHCALLAALLSAYTCIYASARAL